MTAYGMSRPKPLLVMRDCKLCLDYAEHYFSMQSWCVDCHKDYMKSNLRKRTKEEGRKTSQKSRFKIKYGITLDDYEARLLQQGNKCANRYCNADKVVVDHCHTTGSFRGLLCNKCNLALGHVNDSKDLLQGLIEYLDGVTYE